MRFSGFQNAQGLWVLDGETGALVLYPADGSAPRQMRPDESQVEVCRHSSAPVAAERPSEPSATVPVVVPPVAPPARIEVVPPAPPATAPEPPPVAPPVIVEAPWRESARALLAETSAAYHRGVLVDVEKRVREALALLAGEEASLVEGDARLRLFRAAAALDGGDLGAARALVEDLPASDDPIASAMRAALTLRLALRAVSGVEAAITAAERSYESLDGPLAAHETPASAYLEAAKYCRFKGQAERAARLVLAALASIGDAPHFHEASLRALAGELRRAGVAAR